MRPLPKRPISVWIAQIILGIYGFGLAALTLFGIVSAMMQGLTNPEAFIMVTAGSIAFVGVFIGGFWGMAIRKSWGRWLGVAGLTILVIGAGLTQTSRHLARLVTGTTGQLAVGLTFAVLVVGGLALPIYLLAAGDNAERFFNGDPSEPKPMSDLPPPPPMFDS